MKGHRTPINGLGVRSTDIGVRPTEIGVRPKRIGLVAKNVGARQRSTGLAKEDRSPPKEHQRRPNVRRSHPKLHRRHSELRDRLYAAPRHSYHPIRHHCGRIAPSAEFNGPAFETSRIRSNDNRTVRAVNGVFHGPGNTLAIAGRRHAAPASETLAEIL